MMTMHASAGPVADGSDDDLGMDSDYFNSSGEGIYIFLLLINIKPNIHS